jgi:hypothetical protein
MRLICNIDRQLEENGGCDSRYVGIAVQLTLKKR